MYKSFSIPFLQQREERNINRKKKEIINYKPWFGLENIILKKVIMKSDNTSLNFLNDSNISTKIINYIRNQQLIQGLNLKIINEKTNTQKAMESMNNFYNKIDKIFFKYHFDKNYNDLITNFERYSNEFLQQYDIQINKSMIKNFNRKYLEFSNTIKELETNLFGMVLIQEALDYPIYSANNMEIIKKGKDMQNKCFKDAKKLILKMYESVKTLKKDYSTNLKNK